MEVFVPLHLMNGIINVVVEVVAVGINVTIHHHQRIVSMEFQMHNGITLAVTMLLSFLVSAKECVLIHLFQDKHQYTRTHF